MLTDKKINDFFEKKVYFKLADLALSPIFWAIKDKYIAAEKQPLSPMDVTQKKAASRSGNKVSDSDNRDKLAYDSWKLYMAALLSPILIPATALTMALSVVLAIVAGVIHMVSWIAVDGVNWCMKNCSSLLPK